MAYFQTTQILDVDLGICLHGVVMLSTAKHYLAYTKQPGSSDCALYPCTQYNGVQFGMSSTAGPVSCGNVPDIAAHALLLTLVQLELLVSFGNSVGTGRTTFSTFILLAD